jgi:hypothetical protein
LASAANDDRLMVWLAHEGRRAWRG